MSRERVQAIHETMQAASDDNVKKGKDKIELFIYKLVFIFQPAFHPYENASIDEMVIKFKGRWKQKQYNFNKLAKYHIKMNSVCDSVTSYAYKILIYFGTGTCYNLDRAEDGMSKKIFEYRKLVVAA